MVLASRLKRCLRTGSEDRCDGRILIATLRSSLVSRARYTSPIPPVPKDATISYGPSRVPGLSGISGAIITSQTTPVCSSKWTKNALSVEVVRSGFRFELPYELAAGQLHGSYPEMAFDEM